MVQFLEKDPELTELVRIVDLIVVMFIVIVIFVYLFVYLYKPNEIIMYFLSLNTKNSVFDYVFN